MLLFWNFSNCSIKINNRKICLLWVPTKFFKKSHQRVRNINVASEIHKICNIHPFLCSLFNSEAFQSSRQESREGGFWVFLHLLSTRKYLICTNLPLIYSWRHKIRHNPITKAWTIGYRDWRSIFRDRIAIAKSRIGIAKTRFFQRL